MKIWFVSLIVAIISLFLAQETQVTMSEAIPMDNYNPVATAAIFNNEIVTSPSNIAYETPIQRVLGDSTAERKIYVDLTNQRLYAFEGDNLVYNFLVSTGKWGRTPTGVFKIWSKFRYTHMKGGSVALRTYYNLPNVPYTMFFENDKVPGARGYAIHGAYWHNNFGHPMSHGCINMKTEEAGLIYQWASPPTDSKTKSRRATPEYPGTTIVIYGKAPKS